MRQGERPPQAPCRPAPRVSWPAAGHLSAPAGWRAAGMQCRDRQTGAADRSDRRREYPLRPAAFKCRDIGGIAIGTAAEDGGACNQHVGPSRDALERSFGVDPAVDLKVDRPATGVDALADRANLVELRSNEALPAETGVDAHHQI